MERERIDEGQFWALLAIADRERKHSEIRKRMADLFRASGASRRVPVTVAPIVSALHAKGLVERFAGKGLLGQESFRLTAAGHQACRDEIDLRRRELEAVDKEVGSWLRASDQR